MMSKKPTDYHQLVHCYKCGAKIYGPVYVDINGNFEAYCNTCAAEEMDEDEDAKFLSMGRWRYLDACNDRAYNAYVERCVDKQRDIERKRELLRSKGEERNWQFTGPAEHPSKSIFKNHTLHAIQKF